METRDKGIDGAGIKDFFARKVDAEKAFDTELDGMAAILLDLVPEELSDWSAECLEWDEVVDGELVPTNKRLKEILEVIYADTVRGHCHFDKIKDPEDYGFADQNSAIAGMELLKSAWAGIIDVKIIPPSADGDNYTRLEFRVAG